MQKRTFKIEDAQRLGFLKSVYEGHEQRGHGYDFEAVGEASAKYSQFYRSLGITDCLEAQKIANTAWLNDEMMEEKKAQGFKTVKLTYEIGSEYLERTQHDDYAH